MVPKARGVGRAQNDRGRRDHYDRRPVLTFMRFDMRAPASGPATAAELHTATLDMAEWADRVGLDAVVVTAGAWSRPLSAKLGEDVPLETERGYHVTLPHAARRPRMPLKMRGFSEQEGR